MKNDINIWIGTGRLVKDPELRVIQSSGAKLCNFTLAVNKYGGKAKGSTVTYIDFAAFGPVADIICQHCVKGSELIIENGELKCNVRKGKDGRTYRNMYVQVEKIKFGERPKQADGAAYDNAQAEYEEQKNGVSWENVADIPEDELPF